MARVLCIDDFPIYAEMVAGLLRARGGHEVAAVTVPISLDEAFAFGPDVVVLNLVRRSEALGRPIARFETDVDGAKALQALAGYAPAAELPLVITGLAVEEAALPPGLRYVAFLEMPAKLGELVDVVAKVAGRRPETIMPD